MRVAIADHHQLFREAIKRLLESLAGVKIVGECSSGEEAVELVRSITPDILLIEVAMPGIGGLEALHRIKLMQAGTRVVVLTGHSHAPFPTQMLRAGASGFLTKTLLSKNSICACVEFILAAVIFAKKSLKNWLIFLLALQNKAPSTHCPSVRCR